MTHMSDEERERKTGPHHDIPVDDQPIELSPTEAVKLFTKKMDAFMSRIEARDIEAAKREARIEHYVASMVARDDALIHEREQWRVAQTTAEVAQRKSDEAKAVAEEANRRVAALESRVALQEQTLVNLSTRST